MSGKYALIIGNTEYIDPGLSQLTAPGKDAEDFARVLKDQEIGAFDEVNILLNQPEPVVRGAIDEFFDQKKPDDLLVLYFSGHGVRDELGSLYLAVKNTIRTRLRSTAVKSDYIRESMDQSRSRRQVLILDCCNSGAYAQGTKAATGVSIGTASAFEAGYGRIILTASDSTQFAWEGNKVIGETDNSLFTHYLVEGLEGEADLDGDGRITVDELYDYTYEKVKLATPKQTPSKFSSKQQGEIVLRQITRIEDIKPMPLPDELIDEIEDTRPYVREAAVQKLEKIIKGRNIGLARSAREALEKIAIDDNTTRRVAQMATQLLESIVQAEKAEEERKVREEAERIAAQIAEEERIALEKAEAERKAKEEAELLLAKQKSEEERKAKKEAKRVAALKAREVQKAREVAERTAIRKAQQERLAREKVEFERKAKDEAERLAAQKSEEERLVREKVEVERKAKEEAEKLARAKAEREATEKAAHEAAEKAAKQKAEREAAQKAEREAMELASRKKAEREAAEKAEREAIELATRQKAEREAKERVAGKESKATRPSWLKFGVIGGVILTLCLCGYAVIRFFPMFVVVATEAPTEAPITNEPPTTEEVGGFQIPAVEEGKFNVGMVLIGPHDDGGWSQAHYEGLLYVEENVPNTHVAYIENVPEGADSEQVFRALARKGFDLIFGTSFGYMDPMEVVAGEFPDQMFIHLKGIKSNETNFGNLIGAMENMKYLAGMLAGARAKQDGNPKLGYMATFPIPEELRLGNAIALGMRKTCPECTMDVRWINTWHDPVIEKEAAASLFDTGAQVVFTGADTPAVADVAQEKGKWGITYDWVGSCKVDACLTASYWNWGPIYADITQGVIDGTYKTGLHYFDADSGALGLYGFMEGQELPPGVKELDPAVVQEVRDLLAQMLNGEFTRFDVFKGPINDNKGNIVLPAGQSLEQIDLDAFPEFGLPCSVDVCMKWWAEGITAELP